MDNAGNSKSKTISCDDTQCSTKGERGGGLQCIMRLYFVLRIKGGAAAVHNVCMDELVAVGAVHNDPMTRSAPPSPPCSALRCLSHTGFLVK